METFLIKAAQLVLALAMLIIIHEGGHYLFARIFGIKVEKFYLFFDPWFSLFKWKPKPRKQKGLNAADGKNATDGKNNTTAANGTSTDMSDKPAGNASDQPEGNASGQTSGDGSAEESTPAKPTWRDTEYGIGWIPLGGYVKIAGMIDESMDKEQLARPAQPWEFRAKPAWQRFLVMIGGVLMNFILALVIYAGIAWYWGVQSIPFSNAYLGMEYAPQAVEAGFKKGDIPLSADGKELRAEDDNVLLDIIMARDVTVKRGNDTVTITLPDNFPLTLGDSVPFMTYRQPVVVKNVLNGEPAQQAGLEKGDRILTVGGEDSQDYSDLTRLLSKHAGREVELTALRDNDTLSLQVTPSAAGKLGFELENPVDVYGYENVRYTLWQAIPHGVENGVAKLSSYVTSLKFVFTKDGAKQVGGFAAIGNMFPDRWNWRQFWEMSALLSIILAFMNILPIPALDGGHVMFVLWEMVTRRKPSEKVLEYAQITGMVLLIGLLLLANFNDLYRFLIK